MIKINNVYAGDFLELATQIWPIRADLVVTSPPYPGQKGNEMTVIQWLGWMYRVVKQIQNNLSDNGVVVFNIAFKRTEHGWFDSRIKEVIHIFEYMGFNTIDVYPWVKPNYAPNGPLTYADIPAWEFIFIFTMARSPNDFTFNPQYKPYAKKSIQSDGKVKTGKDRQVTDPNPEGARMPNYVNFSPGEDQSRPKANGISFPPALPRRFIQQYSNKGDVVFDPFCGVGTTLKEAQKLERLYIGTDIDPSEIEEAKQWLTMPYQTGLI